VPSKLNTSNSAQNNQRRTYHNELVLLLAAELLLAAGIILAAPWQEDATTSTLSDLSTQRLVATNLLASYQSDKSAVSQLEKAEATSDISVVSDQTLQAQITIVQQDLSRLNYAKAHKDLLALTRGLKTWSQQLKSVLAIDSQTQATNPGPSESGATSYVQVPILIYHYPPSDLEQQLLVLKARDYTPIDLGQLVRAMHGQATLPAKPVVITFDDGYENQMSAFALLQRYDLKATFFIIDGGQGSNWCIGAGRKYHLPSQPAGGCGDAYLTWDQIRTLDKSGLITIGSHTIDHPDLATLSVAQQWFEIDQGKLELESQLGHPVYDFAYPYGDYNQTTLALVKEAGFRSAVTTTPGIDQYYGGTYSEYELDRVRSAYALP
jgi:peptidoglycan/xylan/chitin deacetylase (PgdA/CDA1 family)